MEPYPIHSPFSQLVATDAADSTTTVVQVGYGFDIQGVSIAYASTEDTN